MQTTVPDPPIAAPLVPLTGDWALAPQFAVRSAGFPVSGLEVFGAADESARLHALAGDERFREALTWQNRAALETALDKLSPADRGGSKRRQREALVASYWQRYCSKNDTIGFFGPLGWGTFAPEGPALSARSRGLLAHREVHFEAWCIELLARELDDTLVVPPCPWPERELRPQLERLAEPATRRRGLAALERLEEARDDVARADAAQLGDALDAFDRTFTACVGSPPVRVDGLADGGRSPLYLDCLRDLDVVVGPALLDELSCGLVGLLEASRWYCGRVCARGADLIAGIVGSGGPQPLAPLFAPILMALLGLPALLADDGAELERRWATLLLDRDPATFAARAAHAFTDHGPAWPYATFQSPDIQIAAADADAVGRGEFLAVVGDFHGGTNPLMQGTFAHRHPDRPGLLASAAALLGSPKVFLIPPRIPGVRMTARLFPAMTQPEDVHVSVAPGNCMPEGYRTVPLSELVVDGHRVTDRAASFSAPLTELFQGPMLLAVVQTFDPFGAAAHIPRTTVGRTVLRRETWNVPIGNVPADDDGIAGWAQGRGMPRRVFCLPPDEPKPLYVDFTSPVLRRILCRRLRRAASAGGVVRFSEMLPGPTDCWLEHDGEHFTSELRLVGVDVTRARCTTTA